MNIRQKKSLYESIMKSVSKTVKKSLNEMAVSRAQLAEYDEIELFNDTYIKVKKGDKYNLIDGDGNYLSTTWFDAIKKNNGGGVDVIVQNEKGQKTKRSYTDYHDIKKSDELSSLIKHTDFLSVIDIKDVIIVTPYKLICTDEPNEITIVAQVSHDGNMVLISNEGTLYNQDGTLYEELQFSISMADINRLTKICDKLNRLYADGYDPDEKDAVFSTIKKNTAILVFGYNTKNKTFNTSFLGSVINLLPTPEAWGGDSIKLRIFLNRINKRYYADFKDHCKSLQDKDGNLMYNFPKKPNTTLFKLGSTTAQFAPTELNALYDELAYMLDIINYS